MRILSSSGLVTIGLGVLLAACGTEGDDADGGTSDAARGGTGGGGGTGGSAVDMAPIGPTYRYLAIVDDDSAPPMCTSGPGADIDGVALKRATATIGNGTGAMFVSMFPGVANTPCAMCGTPPVACMHSGSAAAARAEGAKDGMSYTAMADTGYIAINGGALWLQIGTAGAIQDIKSGDTLTVWEVDKTYGADGKAPPACCGAEKYKVYAYITMGDGSTRVQLTPTMYRAANTECPSTPGADKLGCGTTDFLVP